MVKVEERVLGMEGGKKVTLRFTIRKGSAKLRGFSDRDHGHEHGRNMGNNLNTRK
jgi:hypothetical protein